MGSGLLLVPPYAAWIGFLRHVTRVNIRWWLLHGAPLYFPPYAAFLEPLRLFVALLNLNSTKADIWKGFQFDPVKTLPKVGVRNTFW